MNSLTTLVNKTMRDKGISRSKFIQAAGCKNINKGLRKFDAFLDNPRIDNKFVAEISNILEVPDDALQASIKEVRQAIEDRERAQFKPFIQITLDKPPSPIFVAAMIPSLTHIKVPEAIASLQEEQEIAQIKELYRKHRDKHSPGWPSGNGFCYYRSYDEALCFDRECRLIDKGACSRYAFSTKL